MNATEKSSVQGIAERRVAVDEVIHLTTLSLAGDRPWAP